MTTIQDLAAAVPATLEGIILADTLCVKDADTGRGVMVTVNDNVVTIASIDKFGCVLGEVKSTLHIQVTAALVTFTFFATVGNDVRA